MPLKWKIYYASALFNTLFTIAITGLLGFLFSDKYNSSTDRVEIALTMLAFVLIVLKFLLSVKFINLFTNRRNYSKPQRVLFIIGYCLQAILFVLIVVFLVYAADGIAKQGFIQTDVPRLAVLSITTISFFTFLYQLIFDFPLLKIIRRQHDVSIDTIGSEITHEN